MIKVAAFYKFVLIVDCDELQTKINKLGKELNLLGTVLIATEGINSTLCGEPQALEVFFEELKSDERFNDITLKISFTENPPFHKWKVKIKREIVSMGIESVNPNQLVGTYIQPNEWNQLICQPDVLVVDCRNSYEYNEGTFANAVDPNTNEFNEFPEYVKSNLKDTHQKVAMFCTGGIRCEKATAYMKQLGFENVYHLKGGILQYLEDIPENQSLFQGHCFVFDDRRGVDHKLEPQVKVCTD